MRKDSVYVEDLSSNGTVVNGKAVKQSKTRRLNEGDVISIPGYEIELDRCVVNASVPRMESAFDGRQTEAPSHRESLTTVSSEVLRGLFSVWEIVIVVAALASFALVIYYAAS